MAEQQTQFAYHNIQLYKSESLGSGSYGGVCKAKCDGLLCAAKIMHPTLFDLRDPGTASYLRKFHEECHLLSLARHPNVVQYLATYYDPDTRLPVLLMELCDESLTAFLERSPGPLSYHIQLNICLDIALALVYLHSNGLIHRDLTGNNVLMIAGTRAKITDFGMSKLATGNPRMTALTLCPGNLLYMSPEALDEAKSYTAKLDIFSFGVIVLQILTRQFPNPTDRFRIVYSQIDKEVRRVVPETERRQAHLQLIPDTHSLKPVALQCLKKEMQRPSAFQLSERLSELKQALQYTESMHQAQNSSEIQQLEQQFRSEIDAKTREASEHQARSTQLQRMMEAKDRQLQEKQQTFEENQRTIATKQHAIETKERQLQQTQQQLRDSQQLVEQFQQSLQHKDKTISDLQQTISHHEREREIQQLKQQDIASSIQPQQLPVTAEKTQTATAVSVAQKDISKMTWREGKKAPPGMIRGAAVVYGNIAYFRPAASIRVYSYQNILGNEQWSRLPDNPNEAFSLAVIDGVLTSVGGRNSRGPTNTLLSLTGEGVRKQWSEVFPPMPTPRGLTACITTKKALVVAGGIAGSFLATVEVIDINTKQWTTVCPLPQKLTSLSGIVCGHSLYLAGGTIEGSVSKSVFTCYLPDLWQPETVGSRIRRTLTRQTLTRSNVWKEISSLPVTGSTLASFGGHLLAIGGRDDSGNPTTDVYRYDSHTDSWHVISQMKNKRSWCLAVTLPEDRLMVVGGWKDSTNSVEILDRQLLERQQIIETKDQAIQETKQHAIETKERELQPTQQQLRGSQQLVEQFQQSLQHKDKTISDLQQTISHHEKEREIQQLKQQDIASSIQPQQLPVTAEKTQTATAASVAQKDISKMTWREAPERMERGGAVVDGNIHETQILLPTSGPPIDPYNTREYIPTCFTPVATLSQCTHDDRQYYDEHNDFGLEIPAGAIPEGESITIDIGVALYGPFQYPECLRPVSPVFWVCVRDQKDFQFVKPVKVTIPHCLNLESHDDIESLGLTFLKGDHEMNLQQMYQFQKAEGGTLFNPHKRYGRFQTTHFCYLCISSKISRRAIQKAMFCVYAAIPRIMSPREPAYVYFFVTFLLSTCLKTLKKQIRKIPELHSHIPRTHIFQFSKHISNPTLGIVLPKSSAPGWTFGLQFTTEVG